MAASQEWTVRVQSDSIQRMIRQGFIYRTPLTASGSARVLFSLGMLCLLLAASVLILSKVLILLLAAFFLMAACYLFSAAFRAWRLESSSLYDSSTLCRSDVIEIERDNN